MGELVKVPFHGDTLDAVKEDDKVWVSLRRCCENLGVSMEMQLKKLKGKSWATMMEKIMVAEDGKSRSLAMIDLDTLPGWLFSIDARKVKEHIREKLARYQKEAARVLADHFFGRTLKPATGITATEVEQLIRRVLSETHRGPIQATPRFTVQTRLVFKGWFDTSKRQRAEIRRMANTLLYLLHGETPDVSGGAGSGCVYYGHQIVILDEAIDRIREKFMRLDRSRGEGLLAGL